MSDFVDRMNLYNEIVDYFHESGYLFEGSGMLENAIENIILEAPTIDAEPVKHGYWATQHVTNDGIAEELCSGCEEWSIGRNKRFCPSCGRWMDGKGVDQ